MEGLGHNLSNVQVPTADQINSIVPDLSILARSGSLWFHDRDGLLWSAMVDIASASYPSIFDMSKIFV